MFIIQSMQWKLSEMCFGMNIRCLNKSQNAFFRRFCFTRIFYITYDNRQMHVQCAFALWCSGQLTLEGGKWVSCNRTVTESIPLRDSSQYSALPVGWRLVPVWFSHQGLRFRSTSLGLGEFNVHCIFGDLELAANNLVEEVESLVLPSVC